MDMMVSRKVNPEVRSLLYGATLLALRRKDAGIRPIAVGNTLRRLAAKIICNRVVTKMDERLGPRQLEFGTPGGVEVAVLAAGAFTEDAHP